MKGCLSGGALVVRTGQFTGRSPKDKYIVREPGTETTVNWGSVNQPMTRSQFDGLFDRMLQFWEGQDVFVQDCFAGADSALHAADSGDRAARLACPVRAPVVRPARPARDRGARPRIHACFSRPTFYADPAKDGTRSQTAIVINFAKKIVLIAGTEYAGEMKKSIFTILNYLLTFKNVMPMHCSANMGDGRRRGAVFRAFGHRQDHAFRRSAAPTDRRR